MRSGCAQVKGGKKTVQSLHWSVNEALVLQAKHASPRRVAQKHFEKRKACVNSNAGWIAMWWRYDDIQMI